MHTVMSGRSRIAGLEVYVPPARLDTNAVEQRIVESSPGFRIPKGLISRVTGIRSRSVMAESEQASDLAVNAAAKVLASCGLQAPDVDLLVFASAVRTWWSPQQPILPPQSLGSAAR